MSNPIVEHLFDEPLIEPLRSAKHMIPVQLKDTLDGHKVFTPEEIRALAEENPELAKFATPCIKASDLTREGFCVKVRALRVDIHTLK